MNIMRSAVAALAGLAFLVLAACASLPGASLTTIADPGEIYSTWEWDKDIEAGLNKAGRGEAEIEQIKTHYTEKGWPEKLAVFDERIDHPEIIKEYKVEPIATFDNDGTPLVVLRVPAKENKHQPKGWQPTEDIYIVIKQSAVAQK